MRTEAINKELKRLIDSAIRQLSEENSSTTEEEIIGILLAHHFECNGVKILQASAAALEVANFHTECELVSRMITNIQRGFNQ